MAERKGLWHTIVKIISHIILFFGLLEIFFEIDTLPKLLNYTYGKLHNSVNNDFVISEMPSRRQLRFYTKENPMVFSGPGQSYYRSNNAQVDTSKDFYLYAVDGEWVLVEYGFVEENATRYRFGYIKSVNIPDIISLPKIPNAFAQRVLNAACEMTDDPNDSKFTVKVLSAGTHFTIICYMDDYAYIEVMTEYEKMRGFIPIDALSGV